MVVVDYVWMQCVQSPIRASGRSRASRATSRSPGGTGLTDLLRTGNLRIVASDRRHRKAGTLTREQLEERFTTDGKPFDEALAAVLAGGRDDDHRDTADDRGDDE